MDGPTITRNINSSNSRSGTYMSSETTKLGQHSQFWRWQELSNYRLGRNHWTFQLTKESHFRSCFRTTKLSRDTDLHQRNQSYTVMWCDVMRMCDTDVKFINSVASRIMADIGITAAEVGLCLVTAALLIISWRKEDKFKRIVYSTCEYCYLVLFQIVFIYPLFNLVI